MADHYDHPPKPTRAAPPPFVGPPRAGSLAPKPRADRPTLPPFSPPFVKRASPAVREVREEELASPAAAPPLSAPRRAEESPNQSTLPAPMAEVGVAWVNPDQPAVAAPPQAPTGIEWLDSPVPERAAPPTTEDRDDIFGWDPAEDRPGALDTAPVSESLEALKELEPWAMPGATQSASGTEDVAGALERIAARVRSGDLFVAGAMTAASDEALLAAVLAALLQRSRG
jgi:hypothetical protein